MVSVFQSLIGSLKTLPATYAVQEGEEFQSLIGSLKTV